MPILVLLLLALAVGSSVGALAWRYPRVRVPAPTIGAARTIGKAAASHPGLRPLLARRLDPETATGLALTLALVLTVGGGVVLGLLAYLVRTNSVLIGLDNGV